MRAFGYKTDVPSMQQYEFASNVIKKIANKHNWTPDQAQAAIWMAARGKQLGKPLDEIQLRGFADAAETNFGQISFETAPSKTSGLFPELHKAPWEQKMEYHNAMEKIFYGSDGKNKVFKMVGLPEGAKLRAPGIFEGQLSPGTQFQIQVPKAHLTKTGEIEPSYKTMLDKVSAIMGKYTAQDAVAYHRPFFGGSIPKSNGTEVVLGRVITNEEAVAMDKVMQRLTGVSDYAPIASPEGFRIINFGELTNKELDGIIRQATEEVFSNEKAITLGKFSSDGNYISNDWVKNKNGQDYNKIISEGTPDLLRRSDDAFSKQAESVIEEFKGKYGWTDNRQTVGGTRDLGLDDGGTGVQRNGGRTDDDLLRPVRSTEQSQGTGQQGDSFLNKIDDSAGSSLARSRQEIDDRVKEIKKNRKRYDATEQNLWNAAGGFNVNTVRGAKQTSKKQFEIIKKAYPDLPQSFIDDFDGVLDAMPTSLARKFRDIKLVPIDQMNSTGGGLGFRINGEDISWNLQVNPAMFSQKKYNTSRILSHEVRGHAYYPAFRNSVRQKMHDIMSDTVMQNNTLLKKLYTSDIGVGYEAIMNNYIYGTVKELASMVDGGSYGAKTAKAGLRMMQDLGYVTKTGEIKWVEAPKSQVIKQFKRAGNLKQEVYDWMKKNNLRMRDDSFESKYMSSNANKIYNETWARMMEEASENGTKAFSEMDEFISPILKNDVKEIDKMMSETLDI